jgi:Ca2+-binding EF-hand superfamily protein
VSYEDYRHFASLYQHVHSLSVALDFYLNINGKLEHEDFKRATKIITGSEIPDSLVKIVYTLFDLNGDGNLSASELIAVLRKREGSRSDKRSDGKSGLFSCLHACAFDQ